MRINYPYEAIRELAMNLVMHRNYQTNAPAKFYEYSDRIEMDNPGNLYGKVSPDNFPNENDYRNPVIAVAMKTLGYVNQFGRGIETVQEELIENKNGLPVFKFDDITTFKVVVMNADEAEGGADDGVGDTENGINGAENIGYDTERCKNEAENGAEKAIDVGEVSEKCRRKMSEKNYLKDKRKY